MLILTLKDIVWYRYNFYIIMQKEMTENSVQNCETMTAFFSNRLVGTYTVLAGNASIRQASG